MEEACWRLGAGGRPTSSAVLLFLCTLTDRLEPTHPRVFVALLRHTQPAPEWRAGSERIVEALVRDKFRRNAKAREVLLGTGRVKLVYTNTHDDRVWGVCGGESSSSSSSRFCFLDTARLYVGAWYIYL